MQYHLVQSTRSLKLSLTTLSFAFSLVACGVNGSPGTGDNLGGAGGAKSEPDAKATGGAATGGASSGGAATTGGAATGGASTGGAATGGAATGGASTGGGGTGGTPSPIDSGVPGSLNVRHDITLDQWATIVKAANTYAAKVLTTEALCGASGDSAGWNAPGDNVELSYGPACLEAKDICLSSGGDSFTLDLLQTLKTGDSSFSQPQDCSATVAQLEACTVDYVNSWQESYAAAKCDDPWIFVTDPCLDAYGCFVPVDLY